MMVRETEILTSSRDGVATIVFNRLTKKKRAY
jgi:hypothetical protein